MMIDGTFMLCITIVVVSIPAIRRFNSDVLHRLSIVSSSPRRANGNSISVYGSGAPGSRIPAATARARASRRVFGASSSTPFLSTTIELNEPPSYCEHVIRLPIRRICCLGEGEYRVVAVFIVPGACDGAATQPNRVEGGDNGASSLSVVRRIPSQTRSG